VLQNSTVDVTGGLYFGPQSITEFVLYGSDLSSPLLTVDGPTVLRGILQVDLSSVSLDGSSSVSLDGSGPVIIPLISSTGHITGEFDDVHVILPALNRTASPGACSSTTTYTTNPQYAPTTFGVELVPSSTLECDESAKAATQPLPAGSVAAIVICVIVGAAVIVTAVVFFLKKKQKGRGVELQQLP